jgi:hypothetical protein
MAHLEYGRDLIDVTSMHRPDTSWLMTDAHGHEHRWYSGGKPAGNYRPDEKYETPTLVWVKDGEEYWEDDDEPHDVGHLECGLCGEHVAPRYRSDSCRQCIAGRPWFRVDGRYVSEEEFQKAKAELERDARGVE